MSHSTEDDGGTGDGTMESIQLTSEELKFRAELLEAAKRLDGPSVLGEQRLYARFNEPATHRAPFIPRLLDLRRPTIWAISSIAAAAALYTWVKRDVRSVATATHSEPAPQETRTEPAAPVTSAKPTASENLSKPTLPKQYATRAPRVSHAKPTNDQAKATAPESSTKPVVPNDQAQVAAPDNPLEPATPPVPASTASHGGRLVVWDGDQAGLVAKGWSGPDPKKKAIAALPEVGFGKSVGLEWQASGSQWMGFGWNWYSWYPSNAGTDISAYGSLVFKLRIHAKAAAESPEPRGLLVSLTSSGGSGKRASASVNLGKYAPPNLCDGQWHEIVVPLEDLWGTGSNGFDRVTAWEVDIGHWSSTDTKTFTAYVDDIGFQK